MTGVQTCALPIYIKNLDIKFSEGKYSISNIEIYQIPNQFFQRNEEITELEITSNMKKNKILEGNITALEDGYFVFTIPYDKGFHLQIDNQEVEIEKVNDMFMGTKMSKGSHQVTLSFEAPYSRTGKYISILSLIGFIGLVIMEEKRKG